MLLQRASEGQLQDRLRNAREEAYANVEATLASRRTRCLMLDLVEWRAGGDWLIAGESEAQRTMPARDFSAKALDRLRRKVKKGGADLRDATDEARHEVRKDAKKLRYASEFFRALFASQRAQRRYKRFSAALEDRQEHLGTLNDMATGPEELRKLGLEDDPHAQAALQGEQKTGLVAAAADAHGALTEAKRFWR